MLGRDAPAARVALVEAASPAGALGEASPARRPRRGLAGRRPHLLHTDKHTDSTQAPLNRAGLNSMYVFCMYRSHTNTSPDRHLATAPLVHPDHHTRPWFSHPCRFTGPLTSICISLTARQRG